MRGRQSDALFGILLGVIAVYPYIFGLQMVVPLRLFGKSLFFGLVTAAIALLFAVMVARIARLVNTVVLLAGGLSLLCIVLIRIVLYHQSIGETLAFRPVFTLFAYAGLGASLIVTDRQKQLVRRVIVVNSVLQAVIGLLHNALFPDLALSSALVESTDAMYAVLAPGEGRSRETGLLLNASVYANFLLLGLFVLALYPRPPVRRRVRWYLATWGGALLMILGIGLSGSRLPIAVAVALGLAFAWRSARIERGRVAVGAVLAVVLAVVALVGVSSSEVLTAGLGVLHRFTTTDSGGRVEKFVVAAQLLVSEAHHVLLGVPSPLIASTMLGGFVFSDNSYMTLALGAGVTGLVVVLGILASLFARTLVARRSVVPLVYLAMLLALTNAVLWDNWLVTFFCMLYALQPLRGAGAGERTIVRQPLARPGATPA